MYPYYTRRRRGAVRQPFPTDAQARVMIALVAWIDEHEGQSPTIRELCEVMGFRSTRTMTEHLQRAEDSGAITVERRKRRSICVVEPERWRVRAGEEGQGDADATNAA